VREGRGDGPAHRHQQAVGEQPRAGRVGLGPAAALDAQPIAGQRGGQCRVGGGAQQRLGAQPDVAEQQVGQAAAPRRAAVVGRLGDHVGEVDALAEHVARLRARGAVRGGARAAAQPTDHGRLRRRDAQPLGHDARQVAGAAAVPEQRAPGSGAGEARGEARPLAVALQRQHLWRAATAPAGQPARAPTSSTSSV